MSTSAAALIRKGQALRAAGSFDAALSAFEEAARANPELASVHLLIGAIWLQKNDAKKAVEPLKVALTLSPNSDEILGLYAAALAELKKHRRAEKFVREALAKNPNNPKHHWLLGAILISRLRYGAGEKSLRKALEINPAYRLALVELGAFLLRRGRISEAQEIESRCRGSEADHVSVLVFRGKLALKSGDIPAARDFALWALSRNANYKPALSLMLLLQARRSPLLGLWWLLADQAGRIHPHVLTAIAVATVMLIPVPFAYVGFDPSAVERNAKIIAFLLLGYLLGAQFIIRRRLKRELRAFRLNRRF